MAKSLSTLPFLSVGFRPFFFFGTLFSGLSALVWALFWSPFEITSVFHQWKPMAGMVFWHAHEMVNGFVFAIVCGFLLTAVQNWTGMRTVNPLGLALLIVSWLLARVAFACAEALPFWLLVCSQLLPILGLMFAIGRPIVLAKMWRNLFVVVALAALAINEIQVLMAAQEGRILHDVLMAQVFILVLYIAMIAGRVVPFFMANRLGIPKAEEPKWVFLCAVVPLILLIINLSTVSLPVLTLVFTLVLAIAHTIRLPIWYHKSIWQEPMLYSLLLSYACLPIGLGLIVINLITDQGWGSLPLHLITLGTMGALVVAMVGRVSLGHTGRKIQAVSAIKIALLLVVFAGITRVLLPLVLGWHPILMALSGLLWGVGFLVLFGYFARIWLSPRPDQQ